MIPFPVIDPVFIHIGPLKVYWYGIAYVVGTLVAWWYGKRLLRSFPNGLQEKHLDDVIMWILFSAVIGGRIGYVLFYNPSLIIENPLEIFMTWRGGMSFHGGLIGVITATLILTRLRKIPYFMLMDIIAAIVPCVIFLGRIANFINAEMYGRITNVAWGIIYPNGGPFPRHPSQLYEAFLEGIVLFFITNYCWKYTTLRHKPGRISGICLLGYSVFRICIEFFKDPEAWVGSITIGQALTLPLLTCSWYLIRRPVRPYDPIHS